MGKCLIARLYDSLSNDDSLSLGELRLSSQNKDTGNLIQVIANKKIRLKVIGDTGAFVDNVSGSELSVIDIEANTLKTVRTKNLSEFSIIQKYGLTFLNVPNSFVVDLSLLKYTNINDLNLSAATGNLSSLKKLELTKLFLPSGVEGSINSLNISNATNIKIIGKGITGDVGMFKDSRNIVTIELYNTNITGDISVFKNCTNLTNIKIFDSAISGNVEDLVNGLISAGKTSGEIRFNYPNRTNVNFQGTPLKSSSYTGWNCVIKWDNSNITIINKNY